MWWEFRICHDEFTRWENEQHEAASKGGGRAGGGEVPLTGNPAYADDDRDGM